jgi:hypothetical protein
VLFFQPLETTARARLDIHYRATMALLRSGVRLVTMPGDGGAPYSPQHPRPRVGSTRRP